MGMRPPMKTAGKRGSPVRRWGTGSTLPNRRAWGKDRIGEKDGHKATVLNLGLFQVMLAGLSKVRQSDVQGRCRSDMEHGSGNPAVGRRVQRADCDNAQNSGGHCWLEMSSRSTVTAQLLLVVID